MNNRKAIAALALIAATCLLSTGCGSTKHSSAPSTSASTTATDTPTATSTTSDTPVAPVAPPPPADTPSTTNAAPATTSTAQLPPPPPAAADISADCPILKPIANSATGRLIPLQTLPPAQQQQARDQYVGELRGAQANLHSPQGKADLGALINGLAGATSPSAAPIILGALTKLNGDCP